ncbi:MAG: site-specific DNA-methyltransferase, partial [Fibrobacter sp.]|nr:site-specific DNA-methyltransferase [Fibrobacter sp.]
MEHVKMKTKDMADENFKKLAALFPNCVTEVIRKDEDGNDVIEHAIDKDKLAAEINGVVVDGPQERYQFNWPGKRDAIRTANAPSTMTLRPCKEESVDFDNTQNLYIEGDNLEVLKLLQNNYLGKVKMIYIDPPYNTGNDFVYNDDFKQDADLFNSTSGMFDENGNMTLQNFEKNSESNGRFHTDWLNMMYPRLKIARNLLRNDGVILINMDENEFTNLQNMSREIYGEQNELGVIVWDKRNPKGDARGISYQHEYILVYAKDFLTFSEKCQLVRPKKNGKAILKKAAQLYAKLSESYTLEQINDDFSAWIKSQTDFSGGELAYNRIDAKGNVFQSVSMAWPNKKKAPDEYFIPLIHPITGKKCPVPERGWRNPPETMKRLLDNDEILFGVDESTQPRRKYLLAENMLENIPSLLYYGGSDTAMLKKMNIPFDTPKVVDVCMEHIQALTDKDSIILDFFSGSATNAHAVMQLNSEDGGTRKYICVQIPEAISTDSDAFRSGYKNICEIGKERIRRAGKKIKEETGLTAQNLDVGFRVLKLAESNMENVFYKPDDMNQDLEFLTKLESNVKAGRTDMDLLFQVMLECDLPLSSKIEEKTIQGKKVFFVEGNELVA